MYKTLGGYNWSDLFANNSTNTTNTFELKEAAFTTPLTDAEFGDDEPTLEKSILESAKDLQSSFHGLKAVLYICFYST